MTRVALHDAAHAKLSDLQLARMLLKRIENAWRAT